MHFCQFLRFTCGLNTKNRGKLSKTFWSNRPPNRTPCRGKVGFENWPDVLCNVYCMRLDQLLGFICGLGTKHRAKLTKNIDFQYS